MLLVLVFPPFTGHDEVAHFSYIRTVATEHRIPIIPELDEWRAAINAGTKPPGDYFDNDLYPYCRYTLDWLCAPEYAPWAANPPHAIGDLFPSGWQYAANHPPLYYILAAPFYRLTEGSGWACSCGCCDCWRFRSVCWLCSGPISSRERSFLAAVSSRSPPLPSSRFSHSFRMKRRWSTMTSPSSASARFSWRY